MSHLGRLLNLGLPISVAIEVMKGRRDEAFEVQQWTDAQESRRWAADRAHWGVTPKPLWDCDSSRFYLSLDGVSPRAFDEDVVLIEANLAEVQSHLCFGSSRDVGPWHAKYRDKTADVAWRWATGRSVSPTFIAPYEGGLTIVGGMHRFHLALSCSAARMPFIVRRQELDAVLALVPSAVVVTPS
jgi:hypothetical protein